MSEKQNILIIDDIQENIDILDYQLRNEGFNIYSATDAPKGLHILKEKDIDLLLLDINMPVVDGVTLLANIRADKSLSHVPILMVTANDDIKMALECLKKGACGYITKPYSMKQITQQIEHCFK